MPIIQTRRRFLTTLSVAGAAALVRGSPALAVEGSLETTTVHLPKNSSICVTPLHAAEELLRAEGFTDVRYVEMSPAAVVEGIGHGKLDFGLNYAPTFVTAIDAGEPISLLTGIHVGCYELFAREGIRTVADLKGKSVGVQILGGLTHVLVTLMADEVGFDHVKDIHWVTDPSIKPIKMFAEGKIDAFLATPPEPQDLRARHVGAVILNSAVDRPWSHYFCCMLGGNREFVRKYPAATKRVARAILKTTDLCATEPTRMARQIVDGGFTPRYDYALQTLSEVPYDKWREYDAEDTVRFFALRLRDAGFIKSSPQKIIADGTDWRFLDELKRELKA